MPMGSSRSSVAMLGPTRAATADGMILGCGTGPGRNNVWTPLEIAIAVLYVVASLCHATCRLMLSELVDARGATQDVL
jgi:hypothetical protein